MLRAIVGIVAFGFLATCGSAPALAMPSCASTAAAVEFIQKRGITPLVLQGKAMAPLITHAESAGWEGSEKVRALAVLFTPDGAAVFFVNEASVCGPMLLDHGLVKRYLKPA